MLSKSCSFFCCPCYPCCCRALINEMTVCILQAAPAVWATEIVVGVGGGRRQVRETPSKIQELHATATEVTPFAGSGLLPAVTVTTMAANCSSGSCTCSSSNSGKCRTVKSFVAVAALELFAEIQINKMPNENCCN